MKKVEPWYIHAALITVILILVYILIRVAIVDPGAHIAQEKYYTSESRLRMNNIRQAQILWEKEKDVFAPSIDSLVAYVKNDTNVHKMITGIDTITGRSSNPFVVLSNSPLKLDSLINLPEELLAQIIQDSDSLLSSPKSGTPYILEVDTSVHYDTAITRYGKIKNIDTVVTIGTKFYLECPDGYGSIGSLTSDALKNTATWE